MRVVRIVTHHENPEKAAQLFAEQGLVAVGFDIGNPEGKNRDQLKELFINEWGSSEQEAASAAAGLLRFRDEIEIGDIVLAYQPVNMIALVGTVEGGWEYNTKNVIGDPDGEIAYPNQRKVRWWDKPRAFHRRYLPQDLSEKVKLPGTIHIFEYDLAKLKESLEKIPSDEVEEKAVEAVDEDEIKEYLETHPTQLEEGLVIVKREHKLSVGTVDFFAKDGHGMDTLIEVKIKADDSVVGQLLGYMQAHREAQAKDVRGIVVAERFTERCKKAVKGLNVTLYECRKTFNFGAVDP